MVKVAVVGATGNVGREMLQTLAQRNFPAEKVFAVASARSAGKEVSFGDDEVLKVHDLEKFDFNGIDIALMSAGGSVSEKYAPKIAAAGCEPRRFSFRRELIKIPRCRKGRRAFIVIIRRTHNGQSRCCRRDGKRRA